MLMMVENGEVFWLCPECDTAYFDDSEIAFGHDCEV